MKQGILNCQPCFSSAEAWPVEGKELLKMLLAEEAQLSAQRLGLGWLSKVLLTEVLPTWYLETNL